MEKSGSGQQTTLLLLPPPLLVRQQKLPTTTTNTPTTKATPAEGRFPTNLSSRHTFPTYQP
jgi:hypothetical protein